MPEFGSAVSPSGVSSAPPAKRGAPCCPISAFATPRCDPTSPPMPLYRWICALAHHGLVRVLLKCHPPLPVYILADEKHSRCLTARVYLPTIVSGRVIWHLGYSASKSASAFTASYSEFQRAAS